MDCTRIIGHNVCNGRLYESFTTHTGTSRIITTWVIDFPTGLVRFIGVSEILGGLGLLIPSIFRFKPFLTVWAALGLGLVMIFAAIFHASRGEFPAIGINVILLAVALFIAWGRSKKTPILAK